MSFKVKHRPEAAIGTDIFNTAAIFFDHNPPIFTNTTQHRLGVNFILSADWAPVAEGLELAVFPNPMADEARVEISGWEGNGLFVPGALRPAGEKVSAWIRNRASFFFRGSLPSGLYTLRVLSAGRVLGNGKLVVR